MIKFTYKDKVFVFICSLFFILLFYSINFIYTIYEIDTRSTNGLSKHAVLATIQDVTHFNFNNLNQINCKDIILSRAKIDNEIVHEILYLKATNNDYYKQIETIMHSKNVENINSSYAILGENVFNRYKDNFTYNYNEYPIMGCIQSNTPSLNNNSFIVVDNHFMVLQPHDELIIDGAQSDIKKMVHYLQTLSPSIFFHIVDSTSLMDMFHYRKDVLPSVLFIFLVFLVSYISLFRFWLRSQVEYVKVSYMIGLPKFSIYKSLNFYSLLLNTISIIPLTTLCFALYESNSNLIVYLSMNIIILTLFQIMNLLITAFYIIKHRPLWTLS